MIPRAIARVAICCAALALAPATHVEAQTGSASQPRAKRGVLLRLDVAGIAAGEGLAVALDSLAESGKTATFEDALGPRLAAEVEIVPGFWFDGSVGFFDPTLEVTTHRAKGEGDIVQTTNVSMVPVLVGFEFRPRHWRDGSIVWGMGIHYAWVRYGALPSEWGAELESTSGNWGFDARIDLRFGKKPWMLGFEVGLLAVEPELTDSTTGTIGHVRTEGFHWAVGVSRVY